MNKIIVRLLMFIYLAVAFTNQITYSQEQQQKPDESTKCPVVAVDCPTGLQREGDPLEYKVTVSDIPQGAELSYRWEVSKGKIIEGQGTTSIKVELQGKENHGITATVEVGGLDKECTNKASCTGPIAALRKAQTLSKR